MAIFPRLALVLAVLMSLSLDAPLRAAAMEKRIALVIGNASYPAQALPIAPNDAGLVAQTLQAAGFDVIGARDLDADSLRRAFRDFLDKAAAAGPDAVVFVYLAGYGLQFDGENYFAPVDAKIATAADAPSEALRLSDYTKKLAALPLKASIIVLDAARANSFAASGPPLAGGLALVDADPNMLIGFNATPGSVAPEEQGPYGAYATALAEMIRDGGLPLAELFDRVRLRVNEVTKGAAVPWSVSRVEAPFVFFERAADAPPPAAPVARMQAMSEQPLRDLGARDAYAAALYRDSLQGYEDFLVSYPADPMAARVRAMVAVRREAITWRRTCLADTPDAYWSYLRRYPRGPHAPNARWRLTHLSVAIEPPPSFAMITYDVPPPPPEEIVYVDRPVLVFSDPAYAFAPPPPPPIIFLPPPPPEFVVLPPPPPSIALFALPDPPFIPVNVWVNPPAYVAPPPNNVIFNNIHNQTVINSTTNTEIINAPGAPPAPALAGAHGAAIGAAAVGAGAVAGAIAGRVALPPSVAQKATLIQDPRRQGSGPRPATLPGPPPTSDQAPPAQANKPIPLTGKPQPGHPQQQGALPSNPPQGIPQKGPPASHARAPNNQPPLSQGGRPVALPSQARQGQPSGHGTSQSNQPQVAPQASRPTNQIQRRTDARLQPLQGAKPAPLPGQPQPSPIQHRPPPSQPRFGQPTMGQIRQQQGQPRQQQMMQRQQQQVRQQPQPQPRQPKRPCGQPGSPPCQ